MWPPVNMTVEIKSNTVKQYIQIMLSEVQIRRFVFFAYFDVLVTGQYSVKGVVISRTMEYGEHQT